VLKTATGPACLADRSHLLIQDEIKAEAPALLPLGHQRPHGDMHEHASLTIEVARPCANRFSASSGAGNAFVREQDRKARQRWESRPTSR